MAGGAPLPWAIKVKERKLDLQGLGSDTDTDLRSVRQGSGPLRTCAHDVVPIPREDGCSFAGSGQRRASAAVPGVGDGETAEMYSVSSCF